jgi:hypothetical protein
MLFAQKSLAVLALGIWATAASADGGLSFIIDGNTLNTPFAITNTSTGGEFVVGFGIDLAGTNLGFDTIDGGFGIPNSHQFAAFGGTGATTGLVSSPDVADGATSFGITFSDFDPGETFQFLLDVDPFGADNGTVLGNEMIGASAYVDFSNGLRAIGILAAVAGNDDASAFTVTSVVPTPAVPEPASWAMMIAGFGLIGGAMRRRVARVSFAV